MSSATAALNLEISTLVKLLALRGGGAIPIAVDETSDAHGMNDDDGASVDTTEQDALAQEGDTWLKKRFLNRLSEVLSAQKTGRFVAAAVMREDERENCVDVWVARNCGFPGARDKKMVRRIENSLNEMAKGNLGGVLH